jgi:phytoene dehydrogenase-like protein
MLGHNKAMTHKEISKFSAKDAEALPKYEQMLERVASFLEPTLIQTPPNPWSFRPGNLLKLAKLGMGFAKLGVDGQRAIEILTGAATPILDRWFESEQLKVTLATDAIIGAMASPSMPGTAYVLFHHVMGECDGIRGVWGYVRGGMGGISNAIAASAREKGAEIRTGAEVLHILVEKGEAVGVALKDGTEVRARRVASGVDANVTILKLVGSSELPAEFVEAVRNIDYSSASL